MGYRCWLINFGYFIEGRHETVEQAVESGSRYGFEFSVVDDSDQIVGSCTGVTLGWVPHDIIDMYHGIPSDAP